VKKSANFWLSWPGFTRPSTNIRKAVYSQSKYGVTTLVSSCTKTASEAIAREKAIKRWQRSWKFELIESSNPYWLDLWKVIIK